MYGTISFRRTARLFLAISAVIAICSAVFFVGSSIFSSAESEPEEAVKLPVIMYHSVYGRQPSEYVVTPEQLESDLSWLSENGYRTVTAQQLIDYTRGRGSLPHKPVMITLDDGYYNNLTDLLPLLRKYDMTALISVVGAYTDTDAVCDPHIRTYSYLTWEDIGVLAASGRIEFGNHTYDMHSLSSRKGCSRISGESEEDYRNALRGDIMQLQSGFAEVLGFQPVVFTYPFGAVSRESIPVIRDCGFLMTLTCRERPNLITRDPDCLYGIGRYNRSGTLTTEEYMRRLTGE